MKKEANASFSVTVVGKKALEIYAPRAVLALFEPNKAKKCLVVCLSDKHRVMYSAQIDKVKRTSAHYEQRVAADKIHCRSEIVDHTALIRELKLTYTAQAVVNVSGVRQKIGVVYHSAFLTDSLLLGF